MKKIEIHIPDEAQDKNSVFSHCLSFLRESISNSDIPGNLKPLGNTELISEKHLAGLLSKKLNSPISEARLAFYKRKIHRETGIKFTPIKKYSKVSDTKVYLKQDVETLIDFIIKDHG